MTFHGKPRADEETMHHVHESPRVMLLPLFVLALGAVFAGYPRPTIASSARTRRVLARARSSCCRRTIRSRAAEHVPALIAYLPLIAGWLGIAIAYVCYIVEPGPAGAAGRCGSARSTCSSSTNGISTSSTIGSSCAGLLRSAMGCGRTATARSSTGSGPTASPRRPASWRAQASRLQTGYVYHYAFAMLIGVVALVTWYLLPR